MTTLRSLLYYAGFSVWTLVLSVLGVPTVLFGWRAIIALSVLWTRGTFWWLRLTTGLDHEVLGRERLPDGPSLIAIKHQSAWDTLLLNQLVPNPAIVYKRELNWLPLVGWYIAAASMIPVDRKGGAGALRQMIEAAERALAQGRSVTIFPEGTRGPVGAKLPYQPGVAALYSRLGVPLVPVALNSGLFWGRRAFLKHPGRITVEILPPIPAGLNRRLAIAQLEERIEDATARLVAAAGAAPVDNSVGKARSVKHP
jgi:1-acyl-sn-glycerol-3-phosphate acyltransferase